VEWFDESSESAWLMRYSPTCSELLYFLACKVGLLPHLAPCTAKPTSALIR
jgi:hypothetical protein